ncbi:MAG: asparagine--tRNA ligase [Candidatus Aenigmarchaeota archaeon]|nr:asparagine--tRNA ligase [Candidatus Aenigmarchaeota archaeon]
MRADTERLLTGSRWDLLHEQDLAAVARVEGALAEGALDSFMRSGFVHILTPHITKATGACENIETLFSVDYFGSPGFLVQTGQLYLEAFIPRLQRVYCMGPSFRAEPAVDARHLTEFPLLEIEFATPPEGGLQVLMAQIEETVTSMLRRALATAREPLELLGADIPSLRKVRAPFPKIPYREAISLLNGMGEQLRFGDDLKHPHEQKLAAHAGGPVFITHYPKAIKFFNMRENPDQPAVVNSADLILPHSGEAVGAAEREHDYGKLLARLQASSMLRLLERRGGGIEDFRWYLDLVRAHPVPHAGCGIGLNRVTQFVLGSGDIRASTAFPLNKEFLL